MISETLLQEVRGTCAGREFKINPAILEQDTNTWSEKDLKTVAFPTHMNSPLNLCQTFYRGFSEIAQFPAHISQERSPKCASLSLSGVQ